MVEHLDQESKLERRTLRAANEVFLKLLRSEYRRAERNRRAREAYNAEETPSDPEKRMTA